MNINSPQPTCALAYVPATFKTAKSHNPPIYPDDYEQINPFDIEFGAKNSLI